MYPVMLTMFVLGVFIELVGVATVTWGEDRQHWGAVAVFIGAVFCMTSAILLDGMR